jgi:fatty acid amide hydrolase 2
MNSLLDMSAMQIASAIQTRTISVTEVVETHIRRIEEVNDKLNAVIDPRFEQARKEALAADAHLASTSDPLPSLFGVPCTIKEFIAVKGQSHTGGLAARKGIKATEDAVLVQRLKDAGAIILGSTNGPEGGLWMETYNTVYGRTENPWNPKHTAGGSSGGEGAILSAGGSAFGIGSDVGGSIRIPAAFCGIVGHKPTGALVPTMGHQPPGHVGASLVAGPMARRVEDIWPILTTIAGPSPRDPHVQAFSLGDPKAVDLSRLRVYSIDRPPWATTRSYVRETQAKAVDALAARGATLLPLRLPALNHAIEIWSASLQEAEQNTYDVILGDGQRISAGWELLKWPFTQSPYTFPALVVAFGERFAGLLKKRSAKMVELGHQLRQELADHLRDDAVLLYPSYTRAAPRHHHALLTPTDWVCTAIFNILHNPVTQVPLGFAPNGLPMGLQVVAGPGMDHVCVAAAQVIEEAHGGWTRSMT